MIIGIDEAGRGPLAGPLVVVAVASNKKLDYAFDSKKLTFKKRQEILPKLYKDCEYIGIGWATNKYIDKWGLSKALHKAALQAISGYSHQKQTIIIDGKVNILGFKNATCMPKADSLVKQVSAASIVAKVTRDSWMISISTKYPDWGFEKHYGYGTKKHIERLMTHEATPIHRKSFAPLSKTNRKQSRKRNLHIFS